MMHQCQACLGRSTPLAFTECADGSMQWLCRYCIDPGLVCCEACSRDIQLDQDSYVREGRLTFCVPCWREQERLDREEEILDNNAPVEVEGERTP